MDIYYCNIDNLQSNFSFGSNIEKTLKVIYIRVKDLIDTFLNALSKCGRIRYVEISEFKYEKYFSKRYDLERCLPKTAKIIEFKVDVYARILL